MEKWLYWKVVPVHVPFTNPLPCLHLCYQLLHIVGFFLNYLLKSVCCWLCSKRFCVTYVKQQTIWPCFSFQYYNFHQNFLSLMFGFLQAKFALTSNFWKVKFKLYKKCLLLRQKYVLAKHFVSNSMYEHEICLRTWPCPTNRVTLDKAYFRFIPLVRRGEEDGHFLERI